MTLTNERMINPDLNYSHWCFRRICHKCKGKFGLCECEYHNKPRDARL